MYRASNHGGLKKEPQDEERGGDEVDVVEGAHQSLQCLQVFFFLR